MKAITQKSVIGVVALVVGLIAGMQLGGSDEREEHVQQLAEEQAEVWTCSMHPQIRMPEPGQCPICAMDLIPVPTSGAAEELGPRQLRLSPSAQIPDAALKRASVTPSECLYLYVGERASLDRQIPSRIFFFVLNRSKQGRRRQYPRSPPIPMAI